MNGVMIAPPVINSQRGSMDAFQDKAWSMMKSLDFCMLVTSPAAGLRSRPMSSIVEKDEGAIYFLTARDTLMDDELSSGAEVLLCYGNGSSQFVSASGQASINSDRALIKRLWNPGAQAFWPNGPMDPKLVVVTVRPHSAEYWDGPGAVVSTVKFAAALLTGSTPDMGENRKVDL